MQRITQTNEVVHFDFAEKYVPDEIWLNIFSYLQSPQEIVSFGLTNMNLQQISLDSRLWKSFLEKHFPRSLEQNRLNVGESELYKRFATIEHNIRKDKFKFETREFAFTAAIGVCQVYENRVFSACFHKTIQIFDLQTQTKLDDEILCENSISYLHVHGDYLYVGGNDTIEIWDLKTFKCVDTLKKNGAGYVRSICVDGDHLFVGMGNNLQLWNIKTKKKFFIGELDASWIKSLGIQDSRMCAFLGNGQLMTFNNYKAFVKDLEEGKYFPPDYSTVFFSKPSNFCSFATFENWICVDRPNNAEVDFCEFVWKPRGSSLKCIRTYKILVTQSLDSVQMWDGCLYIKDGRKIHILDFNGLSSSDGSCDLIYNV